MLTSRRRFLSLLGLGTAAAAVPAIATPFVRRVWAVPSNAPVGSRVELVDTGRLEPLRITAETWAPSRLALEHGYTYSPLEPLTLAPMPPEHAAFLEHLQREFASASGLNSVARGDLPYDVHPANMVPGTPWCARYDHAGYVNVETGEQLSYSGAVSRGLTLASVRAVLADAPSRIDYFITTDRGDQNA